MTISQAYYRIVIQEDGLDEKAIKRMHFAANLIVSLWIDDYCDKIIPNHPPVLRLNFETSMQLEIWNNHYWNYKTWVYD